MIVFAVEAGISEKCTDLHRLIFHQWTYSAGIRKRSSASCERQNEVIAAITGDRKLRVKASKYGISALTFSMEKMLANVMRLETGGIDAR